MFFFVELIAKIKTKRFNISITSNLKNRQFRIPSPDIFISEYEDE